MGILVVSMWLVDLVSKLVIPVQVRGGALRATRLVSYLVVSMF